MTGKRSLVRTDRDYLVARAANQVRKAIKSGKLKHFSELACEDCGKSAECYDHRDYSHPLLVSALCIGCNNRRGPGLPTISASDGSHHKHYVDSTGFRWSGLESASDAYDPLCAKLHIDFDIATTETEKWISSQGAGKASIPEMFTYRAKSRDDYFKSRCPWSI